MFSSTRPKDLVDLSFDEDAEVDLEVEALGWEKKPARVVCPIVFAISFFFSFFWICDTFDFFAEESGLSGTSLRFCEVCAILEVGSPSGGFPSDVDDGAVEAIGRGSSAAIGEADEELNSKTWDCWRDEIDMVGGDWEDSGA